MQCNAKDAYEAVAAAFTSKFKESTARGVRVYLRDKIDAINTKMMSRYMRRKFFLITLLVFMLNLYIFGIRPNRVSQEVDYRTFNFDADKQCTLPKLRLEGHVRHAEASECSRVRAANWGSIVKSKWAINEKAIQDFDFVECLYRNVTRIDDFQLRYTNYVPLSKDTQLGNDLVEVFCSGFNKRLNARQNYTMIYYQVLPRLSTDTATVPNRKNQIIQESYIPCKPLSLLLLSYDSVSQVSWRLRLKKTSEYMFNKMGFQAMNGFNIIGDGTPAALMPILIGKTEEELPSALKNDPNGKFVDQVFPFIFRNLHEKGYVTLFNEDWPQVGTFQYRMRGAKEELTTHYMRAFQMEMLRYSSSDDRFCIGDRSRHKYNLEILNDFLHAYPKEQLKFGFLHYNEYSHDGNERLRLADDELYEFLKSNHEDGTFDNMAIVLYSDHGDRFNSGRQSPQGYLEERLPFLSVYLPPAYRKEYEMKNEQLSANKNKLLTPFDIHATIKDLACLVRTKEDEKIRSISLLENITETRSCEEIGVSYQYCVCMKWFKIEVNDPVAIKAAYHLITYMNNLTMAHHQCKQLQLAEIQSADIARTKADVYHVKLKIVTEPNKGVYETQVEFKYENYKVFFVKKVFSAIKSPNEISRLNKYGTQADCVSKLNSSIDLRKFCYCF